MYRHSRGIECNVGSVLAIADTGCAVQDGTAAPRSGERFSSQPPPSLSKIERFLEKGWRLTTGASPVIMRSREVAQKKKHVLKALEMGIFQCPFDEGLKMKYHV